MTGTLSSNASTTYTLDFYANTKPNLTFFGEGQRYLGSANVSTDASGNASFGLTLPAATVVGEWLSVTATDPAGDTSEFSAAAKLPAAPVTIGPTNWVPLGPAPITDNPLFDGAVVSGRVDEAVPDPTNLNVMYLASDRGGLWKTSDWLDPSPVWTPLTDSQPNISFTDNSYQGVVVYPKNANIIYAAVAGPVGGILKTTDGGITWKLLANAQFDLASFGSLVISPNDPNTLYVSVWGGARHRAGTGRRWSV